MTDDEEYRDDVDDVELIDFRKPVRREAIDRPPGWADHPSHLSVVELRLAQVHLSCESFADRVTGLVVGENPGPRTHADLPLFPWPGSSAAGRLLSMSGASPGEYLGRLYRRNLVDAKLWDDAPARRRARSIVTALFDADRSLRVVLCGAKVARSFDLRRYDLWSWFKLDSGNECVVIPHPSGLNRAYNDESARDRTGSWIRWALGGDRP